MHALEWPPWPDDDIHNANLTRIFPGYIRDLRKWTSYVYAFESYRLRRWSTTLTKHACSASYLYNKKKERVSQSLIMCSRHPPAPAVLRIRNTKYNFVIYLTLVNHDMCINRPMRKNVHIHIHCSSPITYSYSVHTNIFCCKKAIHAELPVWEFLSSHYDVTGQSNKRRHWQSTSRRWLQCSSLFGRLVKFSAPKLNFISFV